MDGVLNADPKIFPDAEQIAELNYERFTLPHAVFCVSTAPTMISNVVSAGHHPVGPRAAAMVRYSDSIYAGEGTLGTRFALRLFIVAIYHSPQFMQDSPHERDSD